jgi:hypothetical protein
MTLGQTLVLQMNRKLQRIHISMMTLILKVEKMILTLVTISLLINHNRMLLNLETKVKFLITIEVVNMISKGWYLRAINWSLKISLEVFQIFSIICLKETFTETWNRQTLFNQEIKISCTWNTYFYRVSD